MCGPRKPHACLSATMNSCFPKFHCYHLRKLEFDLLVQPTVEHLPSKCAAETTAMEAGACSASVVAYYRCAYFVLFN
jgi:hypothetical protein